MESEKKPTVRVTRKFQGGIIGFHFDYGDRNYLIPLGNQQDAFIEILSLIDKDYDVQLKDCTLSGIYEDIQAVRQYTISQITRMFGLLQTYDRKE